MIKVEIACNGLLSSINAVKGGADRIELFENLADGGCTPSAGMIKKVQTLGLPLYVMIRPRGGDFCYTHEEIDIMLQDIEVCRHLKVSGIVFGCLTPTGEIDIKVNQLLLKAWNGPATFHRAIDRSIDLYKASCVITDLGFERILSSGGASKVMDGLDVLKKMNNDVGKHIVIMPGAGVTVQNAKQILDYTRCREIHATCKQTIKSSNGIMNKNFQETVQVSEADEIAALVKNVKQ